MIACVLLPLATAALAGTPAREAPAASRVAVMIHGAGGGGWEYDRWREAFAAQGWQVIAPDLLPAKAGLANTTFDDYLRQVVAWVPRHRERLVLIGASLGGILALKAAERLKPDALVLINSVSPAGVGPRRPAKRYPAVIRWANGPLKETRDAMPDSDEATILWAHKRWRDESGRVLNAARSGIKAQRPSCPVLVVIGEQDADIPPAASLALARWCRADVHQYAGTSHVGPLLGRRAPEIASAAAHWLEARLVSSRR